MLAILPSLWISQFGVNQGWTSFNDNPRALGDVDGDGKSDIIGFSHDGVYVSLSNGTDFSPATKWTNNYGRYAGGWINFDRFPRIVADVNRDGKADIIGFGANRQYVSLSTGSSFADPSEWSNNFEFNWLIGFDIYPRLVGDINGDKTADIIVFGLDCYYLSYSNGNSFSLAVYYPKSELVSIYGWTSFNYTPKFMGDVNGDGKDDIIGFNYTGVYVSLSSGIEFLAPQLWLGWFGSSIEAGRWTSYDEFPRYVKDFNNDGKADIIGLGLAGVYVALSNGKGFNDPMLIMYQFEKSHSAAWKSFDTHPRLIEDVNGDGVLDIVGFWDDGVHVAILQRNTSDWTSFDLKAVIASSSTSEVECLNECKDKINDHDCWDNCKKHETNISEQKPFNIWPEILAYIAFFAAVAVCCLCAKHLSDVRGKD